MNRKTIIGVTGIVVSGLALAGCGEQNQTPLPTSSGNTSTSVNQEKNTTTQVVAQKLNLDGNRCRGCGKCVRIDPSHFEMSGRKAVVISGSNLGTNNLQMAINNCPAGAITLD